MRRHILTGLTLLSALLVGCHGSAVGNRTRTSESGLFGVEGNRNVWAMFVKHDGKVTAILLADRPISEIAHEVIGGGVTYHFHNGRVLSIITDTGTKTVSIDGANYDPAVGGLFLIRITGNEAHVQQLTAEFGDYMPDEIVDRLMSRDERVRAFLAGNRGCQFTSQVQRVVARTLPLESGS